VWKAVFGDFKAVSDMFMDCVMCGMCAPVCIADIAPNLVAIYASRAQGVHFTEKPEGLATRIKKIADGEYQEEWERILQLSDEELQNTTASIK
jgi:Na+-translocating ferredoxin:NAD+ oxidoreductase RnfC subunit